MLLREGPKLTFIAGVHAGQVTLESIRAALLSFEITSIDPKAKIHIWGYSGGALASENAQQNFTKATLPNFHLSLQLLIE